jgi:hypothetical protein
MTGGQIQLSSPSPITIKIDHVTIAGAQLRPMERAFADLGLVTDYGGPHSNGITHMALLGFVDGSYIELISSLEPGLKDQVFWGEYIVGDGGPCGWAIQVDDVATEVARVSALDITVHGPAYYSRHRPDGSIVAWDLAFLGDKSAGATLPFIIKDITPREMRVRPSTSVVDGLLTGITAVILGVKDLDEATELFQRVYGWSKPQVKDEPEFGATLAWFEGTPVVLATPLTGHAWLSERLSRFNESPCAYLIGTKDFQTACERFDLVQPRAWFGRRVAWFDLEKLGDVRLAVNG